jgi:hypothetical protein
MSGRCAGDCALLCFRCYAVQNAAASQPLGFLSNPYRCNHERIDQL